MFGCEHGSSDSWRLASLHGMCSHLPEDKEIVEAAQDPTIGSGINLLKDCVHYVPVQMMDEIEDYDELIGPAPPDLLDEIEAAGDDDRAKEVVRIIR